ncbi:LOW QUALITY PROTEIN: hypothetical protein HID58_066727 [Brassica napus]|uniref:HTH myb-type domain-containing protein n=2 Tax=Brassica napus TaxID=3708 RepID=A0ABQ7ZGI0_BRANA|nr:LOW QUALITY PROTEIN: hypothetical protein HID58_066727 [Brassica napus]
MAISYLKKETETDTQPLLKDFISLSKPIREEHDEEGEELFKEKKFQLWRENDHISNARFSDTKIKNTLEIERDEEKSSNSLYMLLSPGMTTPKGRRKLVASSFVPQPPPYLQQQALRKQRRCWTPELHRLFVDALQQLGGPGVAIPKQIREHMQEESLTNDEVKSHLQKYRLHIRKSDSNLEKQSVVDLTCGIHHKKKKKVVKEEKHQREAIRSRILLKVLCSYLVQQPQHVVIVAWKMLKMLNLRGEIEISINLKILFQEPNS